MPERLQTNPYYYSALQTGIDRRTKKFIVDECLEFVTGAKALDLGYVDDMWSGALLARGFAVDIVEGADVHVAKARDTYRGNGRVRVFHDLFADFRPDAQYDVIIAGDMIRYLDDPRDFLAGARKWLSPGGRLIVTVPNSRSMHRRIGTLMNIEQHPEQANARDVEVGNRDSYDRYKLRALLSESGWNIVTLQGAFLKPLSSAQMADWPDDLLRAFHEMGRELQDYCWFLYAVCTHGKQ